MVLKYFMKDQSLKVIEITEFGTADKLQVSERAKPEPGPGELLIKVEAAGVNRPDLLQRIGVYPPPPGASDIPGLEVAGTVVAMSDNIAGFSVGDEVCALVTGGGYGEYCIASERCVLPVPRALSMIEAAGLPETFFTVWSNIFDRAKLKAGETLLVHGGSSGIGTSAIALAKAFGARVIVTAGSDKKCDFCRALGADLALNYKDCDFEDEVGSGLEGTGVDVILDMVAGDYVAKNINCLNAGGRLVFIAFLGGIEAKINVREIMSRGLIITGSTLRARHNSFKGAIRDQLLDRVWPLIEKGRVKPAIDSTFPMDKAAEAHLRMESGQLMGKIILAV